MTVEMPTSFDVLAIRRRLGLREWDLPKRFGPDGWLLDSHDGKSRIIVTYGPTFSSDEEWLHASISHPHQDPTYAELSRLHRAVWPAGWAYQVFAPPSDHINIHRHALHLWGKLDGAAVLTDFVGLPSI